MTGKGILGLEDGCTHEPKSLKMVSEMKVCAKGRDYLQRLVEEGDITEPACEQCIIDWVCEDPVEHCLNVDYPGDNWWPECVRDGEYWAPYLATTWNIMAEQTPCEGFFTKDVLKELVGVTRKYGLKITLA